MLWWPAQGMANMRECGEIGAQFPKNHHIEVKLSLDS
jgi:hypothetical protein